MNFIKSISLVFLAVFLQGAGANQNTSNIQVVVTGLRNNTGQLMVSLHYGSAGFPHENMYRQLFITDFSSPTETIIFESIPYGDVAISILHDENKSGDMDFNIVHFPKEGFGFYKNYKVVFKQPNYEDISFDISIPKMVVELQMQY